MANIVRKIKEDKKEYRMQMARVAALPEDYQFVYEKIIKYMWSFTGGDGLDMLQRQYDLIDLFEVGASEGQHVLDVTGEDVATFSEDFMDDTKKWMDRYRKKLNKEVKNKLQK